MQSPIDVPTSPSVKHVNAAKLLPSDNIKAKGSYSKLDGPEIKILLNTVEIQFDQGVILFWDHKKKLHIFKLH